MVIDIFLKKIRSVFLIFSLIASLVHYFSNNYDAASFYLICFSINLYVFNEELKEENK